ncbi:autotransporter outer membrane beta-barrel domain-containing protein [Campylobacter sp. MIT 97-5078]|uniref:autotransporter outer membrane beta-barrel domain-containing protein n=1 Tax=Campylobacter sp. MIT 97-5078 TaxID=1548153 RepID=UPI0005147D8D|nr:autotransporter outer membrane beta-barrel domain-containing protein [Campylobacter sp. MIT 97-5078]KGI56604.1 hypothetical protein LR59_06590 [Campylobacter sp. MIT 97-5078]TQR26794.1 autotransporter domain-containing protein [Campylobacter sp. MIT 97-5078]
MKKQNIFIIFLSAGLYADYTNTLPTSLNLPSSQTHNAIVSCNNPQQCTFNYLGSGQNFTLTSSTKTNVLTLNRQDPTTGTNLQNLSKGVPIYFGSLSISNAGLSINDFDSIITNLNSTLTNSSLVFTGRTNTGSFTNYGNINLTNSDFIIKADKNFSVSGNFTASNSNTRIDSASTIFLGDVLIEGGTATFEKGLSLSGQERTVSSYKGKTSTFTNKGGIVTINGNLNNGAKTNLSINDNICVQLGSCGNAKLVNEGGSLTITGKLVNQTFTDSSGLATNLTGSSLTIQGGTVSVTGGVENKTGSSIDFKPGTNGAMGSLNANVTNNGGTINANISGVNQSGAITLINGTLSGTNTNIAISGGSNMTSSKTCGDGSIVIWQTGTTEPNCPTTAGVGNTGGGNTGGTSGSGSGSGTPIKPNQNGLAVLEKAVFGNKEAYNGRAILATLAQANIVTCDNESCSNIQTTSNTATKSINSNKISTLSSPNSTQTNTHIIQTLNSAQTSILSSTSNANTNQISKPQANSQNLLKNSLNTPLRLANNASVQTLANDESIKNFFVVSSYDSNKLGEIINDTDEGIRSNYLKQSYIMLDAMKSKELLSPYTSEDKFDISAFASGYLGEGNGGLGGLRLNQTKHFNEHILRFEANYAYGSIKKDDEYHKASSNSHMFQLGIAQLYALQGDYELDVKTYASMGKFDTQRQIYFPNFDLDSKGKYNFYQLNGETSLGYRIKQDYFTLKPFIGLSHSYNIRTKVEETGDALALHSANHKAYNLDLLLGFEAQSFFVNNAYSSFKLGYEKMLYNSHKNTIFRTQTGAKLKYEEPYKQRLGASLGGYFYIANNAKMGFEGFYKTAFDDKMDYFGANIIAKYEF